MKLSRPWRDHGLLAGILIFAFALRIATANYSLWLDEIASISFARMPVRELWSPFILREANPPLYYTLLHYWIIPFGTSDLAIKSLSAVIGTVSIYFSYLCAVAITGQRRAGLFAAALLSVAVQHVQFSQDARGYVLAFAGTMAALTAIVRFEHWDWKAGPPSPRQQLASISLYVIGCTVALYSHIVLVALPLLLTLQLTVFCLLNWPRRKRTLLLWILANILVLILWAWWGHIAVQQVGSENVNWIKQPSLAQAFKICLDAYAHLSPTRQGLVILAACGLAIFRAARVFQKSGAMILLTVLVGAPLLMLAVGWFVPLLMTRTLFWASGTFFLLVAAGLAAGRQRMAGSLGFLLLFGIFFVQLFHWLPSRQIENWNGLVRQLLVAGPDMPIVVPREDIALALLHYCNQQRPGPCPFHITIVNTEIPLEWSRGLSGLPISNLASVRAALRSAPSFALVGWGAFKIPPDITNAAPNAVQTLAFGRATLRLYHTGNTR